MSANKKRLNGLSIVRFLFALSGLVFLLTGYAGDRSPQLMTVGTVLMAVGAVLMANGVAAARKAPPPTDEK